MVSRTRIAMKECTVDQIEEVVDVLRAGGVIVFPTETSYGLGCDATNAQAVARIFVIKGRPEGKGLPVLIASVHEASAYIEVNQTVLRLAAAHWPGALNIVAPALDRSPIAQACSEHGYQSVRVSSHPIAQRLIELLGAPLVATSANVSGEGPLFDARLVEGMFAGRKDQPDAVLNAGELAETPASTTVRVEGGRVTVLRQGDVRV